jgi:hypothetical protein
MCPSRHLLVVSTFISLLAGAAVAQQSGDSARNTTRTFAALDRVSAFTPEDQFAPGSPADADIGEALILTPNERYRPFSLGVTYNTLWTSNAFYTPDAPVGDVIMGLFAEAIVLPHLGNNFFLDTAVRVGGYRYFENSGLDFNSLAAAAGLLKVFREFYDVGVYARYEYSYLWEGSGTTLLSEHSISVGARKTFQINRANAVFVEAEADFSLGGWPDYALASEYSLSLAHQIQWARYFNTSTFYQLAAYDFSDGGRADLRNYLGLSAGFKPVRWVTLSASAWLGWNASNEGEYDFFVANLGGSLGASINF